MDLSETIIAAIIGAGATMATAIFQLVRNRAPSEVRPKKNRIRSLFATIALMIGCMVGGYAWSSLRAVSANEQMRATLQDEFTRQFAALAANRSERAATGTPEDAETLPTSPSADGSAGALVQLPPCGPAPQSDEAGVATPSEAVAAPVTASIQPEDPGRATGAAGTYAEAHLPGEPERATRMSEISPSRSE